MFRKEADTVRTLAAGLLFLLLAIDSALSASGEAVQTRLTKDLAEGLPIVVHVVVALCDNANQGIIPVTKELGDGQNPDTNLYWGALYGVRTHLSRTGGWTKLPASEPGDKRILDRAVFASEIVRADQPASVYVVADAWDGAHIKAALEAYLEMAAGNTQETVVVEMDSGPRRLNAAGMAHMTAFVGHNGLMDFSLATPKRNTAESPPKSAVVLACASKPYFETQLDSIEVHALLLTTGLMAPEAYTLDAAIRSWAAGKSASDVRQAAAESYHRYQKCRVRAAKRLFWGAP
jgi:hypothetical protein